MKMKSMNMVKQTKLKKIKTDQKDSFNFYEEEEEKVEVKNDKIAKDQWILPQYPPENKFIRLSSRGGTSGLFRHQKTEKLKWFIREKQNSRKGYKI